MCIQLSLSLSLSIYIYVYMYTYAHNSIYVVTLLMYTRMCHVYAYDKQRHPKGPQDPSHGNTNRASYISDSDTGNE